MKYEKEAKSPGFFPEHQLCLCLGSDRLESLWKLSGTFLFNLNKKIHRNMTVTEAPKANALGQSSDRACERAKQSVQECQDSSNQEVPSPELLLK